MICKKICFIAQFPPPMHGLSKAVETLYESNLNQQFDFEKIDITDNKKLWKNLNAIRKSTADLFYFTISQTKGGNFRDLIILKLLSLQNKKCLIHLHGGYYRKLVDNNMSKWQRRMNYRAIKRLEGVIVLSKSLKAIFSGMIDDKKIFIVPNCVDNEFLMSEDEFEDKVDELEKKEVLHVLYLSNFIKTKGYPEMLEMAKLEKERVLAGENKRLHFDFAGKFFEESEQKFFESYIKKNRIEDFVTYHGIVSGQRKRDLLKQSDIFMLLTRYPNEGQPISILEAMGNGMTVVTTDHAGIPDIVEDGVNGIVLKIEDVKAINTILFRIKKLNYREIGISNRKKVENFYNEDKYLSLMENALNRNYI